jgi:hypothetical protein
MTVARISLTELGYISEAVSSFSSDFRKQLYERVCKKQSYESVDGVAVLETNRFGEFAAESNLGESFTKKISQSTRSVK